MFGQGAWNACYAEGIQNMKRPKTTSVFEKKLFFLIRICMIMITCRNEKEPRVL